MQPEKQIRLLPPELQNQIAAGEVVERPSSVLKELVENALDAGATRIRIQIRDGGQSCIKVSDNGLGIREDQLELAVTRHATSKLENLQDLQDIKSFGFRGEALPSIASVSRFRIASARRDGEGGVLEVLHGRVVRQDKTAMPRGTEVEVSDLFSNVPARLKFLKKPGTETRKCAELVARIALANPHVDFEFLNAERSVHRFLAGQELTQRLAAIWPHEVVDALHVVSHDEGALSIQGLVGDPSMAQARPDRILIYVNSRPVQDKTILSAIREAYRGRILGKEYPQAVVFLQIPPDEVDVNVHPAKTEVRFQDDGFIFRIVRRAVLQTLERNSHQTESVDHVQPLSVSQMHASLPAMEHRFSATVPAETDTGQTPQLYDQHWPQKFASSTAAQKLFESADSTYPEPGPTAQNTHASQIFSDLPRTSQTPRPSEIQYLGQFAQTYLILAARDEITLIDQHAAHERVLFNMLRAQGSRRDRRPLLLPLEIPLHPAQAALAQEIWTKLDELGFSLELAPGLLKMKSIPALLTPSKAKEFLQDILTEKATSMEDLWAVMACKAAIKAGDTLTADEALALVDSWQNLPEKNFCPHGRPVAVRWGVNDLEKLFKRRS
jgi:DNA mismatch repair protein MutL